MHTQQYLCNICSLTVVTIRITCILFNIVKCSTDTKHAKNIFLAKRLHFKIKAHQKLLGKKHTHTYSDTHTQEDNPNTCVVLFVGEEGT